MKMSFFGETMRCHAYEHNKLYMISQYCFGGKTS